MGDLGDIGFEVSHKMQVNEAIGGWAIVEEKNCPAVHGPRGELRTHVWGVDLSGTTQGTGSISGGLQAGLAHVVGLGEHTPPACALRRPAEGKLFLHTSNAATEQRSSEHECCPFGELLHATGPLAKDFHHLFSTKYFDWETGLSYYGHRYYSPTAGRWLSRDPMGERGGVNLYGYCHQNPVNVFDALGLFADFSLCNDKEKAALIKAEATLKANLLVTITTLSNYAVSKLVGSSPSFAARYASDSGFRSDYHSWYANISSVLHAVASGMAANKYEAECECFCLGDTMAYTRPWSPYDSDIHFCPKFFKASPDSQVDILLHELSHLYGGTDDPAPRGNFWPKWPLDASYIELLGTGNIDEYLGNTVNNFTRMK
ncbi:M35 family metallo-endopeptidase [Fontisphaera persica]|uniref:RHS repeat-associated core domain-containing protein n=1 Tax=Fontisphaera persica TaxID=2974023 RepID=UPI0024BF7814|nr:RHS repeat-associated core domain-containing protein [Fontisphaera persica]WCJ58365.1 M35 family metallo-endopeptidase [Fontisphaera persica]